MEYECRKKIAHMGVRLLWNCPWSACIPIAVKTKTVRNQYVVFGNKSLNEIALNFKEKIVSTHVHRVSHDKVFKVKDTKLGAP